MQILPKRKVITQADWNELVKTAAANQNALELEITSERTTMMTDDGKIIIDEKYQKYENQCFQINQKFIQIIFFLMSLLEKLFIVC